jgi:3-hydroxybutyryl-CoA dehydrogenase
VLFDLALDYTSATRLAVAAADTCSVAALGAAVGALQAAGVAVTRLDDVAGLAVMRTVAMLANEAADAVMQGVAVPEAIDVAMQKGVNYPRGPIAWADAIGAGVIRDVLANLAAHYGEDRYRISPLIARPRGDGRQARWVSTTPRFRLPRRVIWPSAWRPRCTRATPHRRHSA